ncbi:hydrogenase subunit MbhD domain-containing protein [Trujillonella humicola]|uniref:hydrogenase subunit MbhD domain-containing protein n=1 Tax=Trujillonella humicola TaxID=3383699 RepID=UPI003905AD00
MTGWATWLVDGVLVTGIVGVAALALTVRDRVSAVALFVVFGLLVSAGYARLAAPDIALAEAAIGAAVTGALLLEAARPRTAPDATRPPMPRSRAWTAGIVVAATGTAVLLAATAVQLLDRPAGRGLLDVVAEGIPDSGVAHPVTAVLLAFRAYDTLLEVVVLLVAALVALALLPGRDLAAVPPPAPPPAPLPFLVRVLVPVGVVVAGWLVFVGSYEPGGAFQGGTVLAGILVLLWLSGRRPAVLRGAVLRWGLAIGTVLFLGVGIATLVLGGGLLDYGPAATGLIIAIEVAIAGSVGVTLAALYLAEEPVPDREPGEGR